MATLFLGPIEGAMATHQCRDSIAVSIPACHAGDPGSIPGRGALFTFSHFGLPLHNASFSAFVASHLH